jgi:two-component system sensor histidine kinase UhpB
MQLVTRLLLRLITVGILMLLLALVLSLFAARNDIGHEALASQKIGQLIKVLSELQRDAPLTEQTQAIDALNQSDALRHFHVALLDHKGRRLTQLAEQTDTTSWAWLQKFLASDVEMSTYSLSVLRPDGQRVTVMLEPNPYSESTEAITSALLLLVLFAALTLALIAAIWISLKYAFAPLADILTGIARIESGDYSLQLAPSATRELNQISQALNHLAAALTEQIAKQRELLHRLQDVQEEERRKLAHELHDEFGQLLTAMQVDASYLLKKSADQPALLACAQAMYDNSSSILSQLKNLLAQLRPYGLQGDEEHDIALEQALRDLVRQRQSRGDTELNCTLTVALGMTPVPQRLAVAVYRIAQEALTNVMRHAKAKRVDIQVTIDTETNRLNLRVADDGVGMDAQHTTSATAQSRGLGLAGIRERILANQGRVQWSAAQPHGLVLDASFPLPVNNTSNSNTTRLPDHD